MPDPDRRAQVLQARNHANKAVRLGRVVRRTQLEHHLLFGAKIDLLLVSPLGQIPDVELVPIAAGEQDLRVYAALDHVRRAPLARDGGVVTEVPPEVVRELLGTAIQLPATLDREVVVVDDEDPARTISVGSAKSADVDAVRAAVNGVGAAVARPGRDLLRFDRVDELWLFRVRLDVEDVNAG